MKKHPPLSEEVRPVLAWLVLILLGSAQALSPPLGADPGDGVGAGPGGVRGVALDPGGKPAVGARVRIQASDESVIAGPDGSFLLPGIDRSVKVTAALPGFRIGYSIASPGDAPLEVRLKPLPAFDNPAYTWEPPSGCVQCHMQIHQEWASSPHSRSAVNPVVLALYRGTRHDGSPSPGFGFRKAHPETYGDCAFCHAPAFTARSADPDDGLDPRHDLERAVREGTEAERSGVTCDFCHKIRSAAVDDRAPRPGRKLTLLRPAQFEPLMFGPFDDVTFVGMGASHSPLHQSSDLCSLCHWDSNRHGVTVGSTYREWLDGPYPAEGKRCQDCHMKSSGETQVFCLWEPVTRNPRRLSSHDFLGTDRPSLERAVDLSLGALRGQGPEGLQVEVEVIVVNSGAGHAVPTGVTMRQALLVVEARRGSGYPLVLIEGPRLPEWAGLAALPGKGPEEGYLSGLPGRGYARITTDGRTERVFDSEATAIVSDTRLLPRQSDRSSYRFALGGYRGAVEVRARVIYRRWWKDLEDERGFPDGDTLMAERQAVLPGEPVEFIRGDVDGTQDLDLSDAVVLLGHLFLDGPKVLPCPDAADTDDSGSLDLTDAIAILGHLFTGAPPPAPPFPTPGPDPPGDPLDC